jgi:hypothetical protein
MAATEHVHSRLCKQAATCLHFPLVVRPSHPFEHSPPRLKLGLSLSPFSAFLHATRTACPIFRNNHNAGFLAVTKEHCDAKGKSL